MSTKLFSLSFIVVTLLSQPAILLAQDASEQRGWATIRAVTAGDKLLIETRNGERTEGRLSNTSDTAITLTRDNKTINLSRDQVLRIYRLSGRSRVKPTLIGTGVGAGIGAGAAAAVLGATGGSDETTAFVALITVVGAGVGAAIGALAGKGRRRTLIYESQ